MTLVKGKKAKTKKGMAENYKKEVAAGKPKKQSIAIMLAVAKVPKKDDKKKKEKK